MDIFYRKETDGQRYMLIVTFYDTRSIAWHKSLVILCTIKDIQGVQKAI